MCLEIAQLTSKALGWKRRSEESVKLVSINYFIFIENLCLIDASSSELQGLLYDIFQRIKSRDFADSNIGLPTARAFAALLISKYIILNSDTANLLDWLDSELQTLRCSKGVDQVGAKVNCILLNAYYRVR